jgi:hypothetical protein
MQLVPPLMEVKQPKTPFKKKMSDSGQNQGIQPDLAKIVHNAFLEINFAHKINF